MWFTLQRDGNRGTVGERRAKSGRGECWYLCECVWNVSMNESMKEFKLNVICWLSASPAAEQNHPLCTVMSKFVAFACVSLWDVSEDYSLKFISWLAAVMLLSKYERNVESSRRKCGGIFGDAKDLSTSLTSSTWQRIKTLCLYLQALLRYTWCLRHVIYSFQDTFNAV